MKGETLSEIRKELGQDEPEVGVLNSLKTGVGILMQDPVNRRLVESASVHLELTPVHLDDEALDVETLVALELIVADEPKARAIREILATREEKGEGVNPAVIAATSSGLNELAPLNHKEHSFDGVLPLPQAPAPVAAQLSLILYSHRAFARRYQTAIEELHLNRRIFRSVTSGICVVSATEPDMPIVYVNPAFEVMTGYSLEDVQGQNCRFLQGKERDQPALVIVREAIKEQREAVAILKNYRKDGSFFWNELSLSPIRNRDGQVSHFVGIQTDVTARVEFEAALRQSEKLAAVGRLSASIAHEINNPLESVMNLIYIVERLNIPDEAKAYLATADSELQRVKLITSQSLRFYKQSTKPQATLCGELVDSVLHIYAGRLENSEIAVTHRNRSTRSIICMESEIRQVLNNFVSNAIDAIRGLSDGKLHIHTADSSHWGSDVKGIRITVADTGIGMSQDTLKEIYKAFYTTKGITGTGLGLWISSEIVQRHQGTIAVRSRTGSPSGTVFMMFLPIQGLASEV